MALNIDAIGTTYPPDVYAVGREKIREYAYAVGETNPLHLVPEAARTAGYADVVAPPMFAVVFAGRAATVPLHDPAVGIDYAHLVHGAQEFRWGPLVVAGDEIATTASVADVSDRRGLYFYVFATESVNQRGETVCRGTWTNIVRPPDGEAA
jgi:acyl dehydratase